MKRRRNRDKINIIGKGAHHNEHGPRVNPDAIAKDIQASLLALDTEIIDLYLLHRDDRTVPVGEIVDCLNSHRDAGRIREFGGSNWQADRLEEANAYAKSKGVAGMVASSPYFGLARQNEEAWMGCVELNEAAKEFHTRTQMPVMPWSSQAGGFFTDRFKKGDGQTGDMARIYYSDANFERKARAAEIAEHKGVSANNVALAYAMHQPFPVFPLIGCRNVEELESSLAVLNVHLSERDMLYLDV